MAIKATATATLSSVVDVQSVTRYYKLQASTLAKPAKPTTNPPANGWVTTEPTYSSGSTNTLYTTDLTVFCDTSFNYSDVSKSSSYEAAREAYIKAEGAQQVATTANTTANNAKSTAEGAQTTASNAQTTADSALETADDAQEMAQTAQQTATDASKVATNYLNFSNDGLVVGDMTQSTLKGNTQITSDGINVRQGTTTLASFKSTGSTIGQETGYHTHIDPKKFSIKDSEEDDVFAVQLKEFTDSQGTQRKEPWVTFWNSENDRIRSYDKSLGGIAIDSEYAVHSEVRGITNNINYDSFVSVGQDQIQIFQSLDKQDLTTGRNPGATTFNLRSSGFSMFANDTTENTWTGIEALNSALNLSGNTVKVNTGNIYGEHVLFDNANLAFSADVTLSDSVANYKKLIINFKDDDGGISGQTIYDPKPNMIISEQHCEPFSGYGAWFKMRSWKISADGKTFTTNKLAQYYTTGQWHTTGQWNDGNFLKIIKVVGCK